MPALLHKLPMPPAQLRGSPVPVPGQAIPLEKVNPDGTLNPEVTSPAGCRFQPSPTGGTRGTIQNAYLSTSNRGSVKVKSYIVCNRPVQALSNETGLYKWGVFGLVAELQASTVSYSTGQSVRSNTGTFRHCTSTASSTFFGDSYGVSEENGQLYEGYGVSPGNATLHCGT